MKMKKKLMPLLIITTLCIIVLFASSLSGKDLETKTFHIKNRKLSDAEFYIRHYLSKDAIILVDYKVNMLTITDHPGNLKLISKVIDEFDRPPVNITLELLIIAAQKSNDNLPINAKLDVTTEKLGKIFKFNKFRLLDKLELHSTEGEHYQHPRNNHYSLHFYTDRLDDKTGAVRLKDFTLFIKNQLPSGGYESRRLLKTDINLIPGQKLIIGGSMDENITEAIIFILSSKTED